MSSELRRRREKSKVEDSLIDFVREAWPWIDPSEFKSSWSIEGLCEHLQAVTEGHIRFLLTNYPPRGGKTNVASICWPAWIWARRQRSFVSGPQVRFLGGSYNHDLALTNSNKTRRLILSSWYQERWGSKFDLRDDQNTKTQFDNTTGGSRMAASVGGTLLGIGFDVGGIDDPHNIEDVESDVERETARNWFNEVRSTRMNNPKESALAVTMQRLNEQDISGLIAEGEDYQEWTHFCVPMHHDTRRHCVTVLKWNENGEPEKTWEDPRTKDGELMWPERFGEKEVNAMKRNLGPYMASGRLEQIPTPVGGGIIKVDDWQDWPAERYPNTEFILASLDTAYTEKEENDASALTIWGTFRDPQGLPKLILLYAWEGRLELHELVFLVAILCSTNNRSEADMLQALELFNRGAVQAEQLVRMPVDKLLVEGKASGKSVVQELKRLYGQMGLFSVEEVDPKQWGDKVARLVGVEPLFADQMIYAPDKEFSNRVINNVALCPKTSKWDTPDSVSMALRYMRQTGWLLRKEEHASAVSDEATHRPRERPLYG